MFFCKFCEISKNTFLQNTSGRLLLALLTEDKFQLCVTTASSAYNARLYFEIPFRKRYLHTRCKRMTLHPKFILTKILGWQKLFKKIMSFEKKTFLFHKISINQLLNFPNLTILDWSPFFHPLSNLIALWDKSLNSLKKENLLRKKKSRKIVTPLNWDKKILNIYNIKSFPYLV